MFKIELTVKQMISIKYIPTSQIYHCPFQMTVVCSIFVFYTIVIYLYIHDTQTPAVLV